MTHGEKCNKVLSTRSVLWINYKYLLPSLFVSYICFQRFNPNFNCQMQFHQYRFSFNIPIRCRHCVSNATRADPRVYSKYNICASKCTRAQYSAKMRNRVKRKPRLKLNFHVRYMRISLLQTACTYISHLGNNPAVDHDPISAEHSVHSAIRNARLKKYNGNKMTVCESDAKIFRRIWI